MAALWTFHQPVDVTSAGMFRSQNHPELRRRRLLEPSPRIINGVETERSRHPYVALLTAKFVLKCGGVVRMHTYRDVI